MTTFSDCMTLLLCFFVLLLTFSSFDEYEMSQLAGAFDYRGSGVIFSEQMTPEDSYVKRRESVVDWTRKGSEERDLDSADAMKNPKELENILDSDAYKYERSFFIPTRKLFLGNSSLLSPDGKEALERMGSFMKLLPCRMIISESRPGGYLETAGLVRSWTILRFFTVNLKLPQKRFSISASRFNPGARYRNEPVMRITLLAVEAEQ